MIGRIISRYGFAIAALLLLPIAIWIPDRRQADAQTGPLPRTQCVSTAIASGTGDAIAIPLLPCTETTTLLILTITHANTAADPTLSVNGQTPHVILNFDESSLDVGFMQPDQRRILTYNGINWLVLNGAGDTISCIVATGSTIGCVKPDNTTITVDSSGVVTAVTPAITCAALPAGGCPFDIAVFWPGIPPNSQIIRVAIPRAVSCPAAFTGSVGIAKTAATASTVVSVRQVTGGVATARGTFTWAISGTVASLASGSGMTLAANDVVEYLFPASADATAADFAMTLKCART